MKTAAEAAKVRGAQIDADFRERLNDAQSTIDVMRASMNVSLTSPTAIALQNEAERRNTAARVQAVSNERMKELGLEGDSAALIRGADQYTKNALLRSIPDIISGVQGVMGGLPAKGGGSSGSSVTRMGFATPDQRA